MSTESDVMVVAGILALLYRITPAAVSEGPAGTATRNYVAEDRAGRRWFVKAYPRGTDMEAERQALALGEEARVAGVPVPAVRRTVTGEVIAVDPADVRAAVTVHHRSPAGGARIGLFFEAKRWQGIPQVMEHRVCDAMEWFPFDDLPEPMVAYCRAGLDAYRAGARMAVHFQKPGDPIVYAPDADRTVLVSAPGSRGGVPEEVRVFAEQAVGRITAWTDVSWAREETRVWRARGAEGGTWYVLSARAEVIRTTHEHPHLAPRLPRRRGGCSEAGHHAGDVEPERPPA